jgi:hypothetical protein
MDQFLFAGVVPHHESKCPIIVSYYDRYVQLTNKPAGVIIGILIVRLGEPVLPHEGAGRKLGMSS